MVRNPWEEVGNRVGSTHLDATTAPYFRSADAGILARGITT